MKVNILGQDYKIRECSEEQFPKLKLLEADGLFEGYSKEIIIDKSLNDPKLQNYERLDLLKNKVIRHEIMHAFFYESGLDNYSDDERLVDWLALQLPKIFKCMVDLKINE